MKAYQQELEQRGLHVHYIEAPAVASVDSRAQLDAVIPPAARRLHLVDPVDEILMKRVARLAADRDIAVCVYDSPQFLTPAEFLKAHTAGAKKPFMARFYEAQRKRMGILVEADGSPTGGQWSFDAENRAKLPKGHVPPVAPAAPRHPLTTAAMTEIRRRFPDNPGAMESFRWPVTRIEASAWLDEFIAQRLEHFGVFEDAISTQHATLYHSAITPMLNIGLLDPLDVVQRVLAAAVPLNSKEGFIRQVIGWREFMRGIYLHRGTTIRNGNFWNFQRPLPRAFYTGTTGIAPVDRVIRHVLADGWCHHIERLMILGNFMLLCRIRPQEVYLWFMELFVDAYDWVMVPNIYGMSQFADGGMFTTKPYLSGSNYVLKMSDESKGPWCAIWDGLYWTFIADHAEFFRRNPRLSMMVHTWMKMPPAKQEAHRQAASDFLGSLH